MKNLTVTSLKASPASGSHNWTSVLKDPHLDNSKIV